MQQINPGMAQLHTH
uniref:Uncharacterized protein n=1 Tax=Rhizophora mucronata TaxID=61149 RepID=A0A2P2NTX3_RHIMU